MNTVSEIVERDLDVVASGRRVPAALWIPDETDLPIPLVLVGHGGGQHKRSPAVVEMAEGLVREHGIAALAIDGPVNGDRETNNEEARRIRKEDRFEYRRRYYMEKYDEMIQDWQAALDTAQKLPELGRGPVGYWGLSMGTRFGVPLIAAEPRIQAAVIGLFGYREGAEVNQRVYDDAPKIQIPVLFLQQLGDEEVGQRAYHDLFRMIGTEDKRLHANPGTHAAVPRSERAASRLFLARKLKGRANGD
ncbi:MAG: dienelactone hydrolase family protein [Pseudomonadales bacterium]|nr:dienelactone hydrolase family protein [Pseudomonadales bacterium]